MDKMKIRELTTKRNTDLTQAHVIEIVIVNKVIQQCRTYTLNAYSLVNI